MKLWGIYQGIKIENAKNQRSKKEMSLMKEQRIVLLDI